MRACDRMLMSCQCFTEMLINFRFGKILALRKSHFEQRSCQNFLFKFKGSNLSIFAGNDDQNELKGRGQIFSRRDGGHD